MDLFEQAGIVDLFASSEPGATAGAEWWLPDGWMPGGLKDRAEANLAAIAVWRQVTAEGRPATPDEQAVLARWTSWGALPKLFDRDVEPEWQGLAARLRELLTDAELDAAAATILNAHYTNPDVIDGMAHAARRLGVSGRLLEPGCGIGSVIGRMPNYEWVGIEKDPVTAGIASLLYPGAVRCEGFETSRLRDGEFDGAWGNPPFARIVLHDPFGNVDRLTMHNHFWVKTLRAVRPGGIVGMLTSHWTMDSKTGRGRDRIHQLAEIITVIRLPGNTHMRQAGTGAVTDLIIVRRRERDLPEAGRYACDELRSIETPTGQVSVNRWFVEHPELMLGAPGVGGMFRSSLQVHGKFERDRFMAVLDAELDRAVAEGMVHQGPNVTRSGASRVAVPEGTKPGAIINTGMGFVRFNGVGTVEHRCYASDARELAALCSLRDGVNEVLASQHDPAGREQAQRRLLYQYQVYKDRYGPLNRATPVEAANGALEWRRPRMGGFRNDPDAPVVFAIEDYDMETGTAAPGPIFHGPIARVAEPKGRVDDITEAIAVALNREARIRPELIAELLDVDEQQASAMLIGHAFENHERPGEWMHAAWYLSGDVRAKHRRVVELVAEDEGRWGRNLLALADVIPPDISPERIAAKPGAGWIPVEDVRRFMVEVLRIREHAIECLDYEPTTATWTVKIAEWAADSTELTATYGTDRYNAVKLWAAAANNQAVMVYDRVTVRGVERSVRNPTATLDAREKQQELIGAWSEWLWADPERAGRLARRYNDLFNSVVAPAYTGEYLTLPGLSPSFTPRPHQLAAIERVIMEPAVGLWHCVGAGKTATIIIAGMEMRRLGLVSKPMVVVPNHVLEQWCCEWRRLYPDAKVLFPTEWETTVYGRREFVARAAFGDWDAVIVTEAMSQAIPLSPGTEADYIQDELADLKDAMEMNAKRAGKDSPSAKGLQRSIQAAQERLNASLDRVGRGDLVCFEQTGVDYLFIDEAHHAKNLAIGSRLPGLGKKGSGYAMQLDARLKWLRSMGKERVCTLATATPISNSLSEMWVMLRYLDPDALRRAGVWLFDAWAATFAQQVTRVELAPEGGRYRVNTRLAKFKNMHGLNRMWLACSDVQLAKDLDLGLPEIAGGGPRVVTTDSTVELAELVADLGARAERVRMGAVKPQDDNMLAIVGAGRRAALDLRLAGLPYPAAGRLKIDDAADEIAAIYHKNIDVKYPGSEQTGVLQLVFAEQGQPGASFELYGHLRSLLAERAVPEFRVRFIQDYKTPAKKEVLFEECRAGLVSVLIGSTDTLGVGTNVQRRLKAVHHLDCPWRPADLEQRDGRILRQGNLCDLVEIIRYVTKGSFDIYSWQIVELKAGFINAAMSGQTDDEVDDVGDDELSMAQTKALATGDERMLRKAGLDNDVARLRRKRVAWINSTARLREKVATLPKTIKDAQERLRRLSEAEAMVDHGAPIYTIGDDEYTEMEKAGDAFIGRLLAAAGTTEPIDAGSILGMRITAVGGRFPNTIRYDRGVTKITSLDELRMVNPKLFMRGMTQAIKDLPNELASETNQMEAMARDLAAAQEALASSVFTEQEHLDELEAELVALNCELEMQAQEDERAMIAQSEDEDDEGGAGPEDGDTLPETQRQRRGHAFWPDRADRAKMPALYATERTPTEQKMVWVKYFAGGFTWWIVEADWTTGEAFGYVENIADPGCSEWGYISLTELEEIQGLVIVERDLWYEPKQFGALRLVDA